MKKESFSQETAAPGAEAMPIPTKRLNQGESTGWEGERVFTVEEVVAAVKEVDALAGDVQVTDQVVSHEGLLLSMSMRAPGSEIGYSYMLKGTHGGSFHTRTVIERIDYDKPDSELVTFAEEIAEYKDGAWVT